LILAKFLDSPQVALHYYLAMTILTAIFSFLLLKYDTVHENTTKKSKSKSFSMTKYWPFWLSLFLMQVSFGGFYNFFTIYEISQGFSLEMTSYLWSFSIVCEVLILYFQAPLLKNNLLTIIKFCILITAIRWFLLYAFAGSLTMTFFSQSLHAFSFGLYHSAVILCLYSLYKDKKLAQQFMFGVAYGLGGFIGALISGWLYSDKLFLYSSIIAFLSLFSLMLMKKRKINPSLIETI
ncbi:MFS transporter, partial [Arcobacter sp. HD9-500m-PIT-SAG03]